jgi:hypothetical protein
MIKSFENFTEIRISKKQDNIKKFNEAIIEWETDNIKNFYYDAKEIISKNRKIEFNELKNIGDKYDIEVVDYDTFHSELPNDQMRKDAPPKGAVPVFALVNRVTEKARIVIQSTRIDIGVLDMAYHMLKHENVHIGQIKRKQGKGDGEFLGDVRDLKSYFSNKDEVMAFSQSIVDQIMGKNPKSLEEAKSELKYVRIWSDIKRNVDEKIKKRYIKYIFLYLEKEFEKLGIKDTRKPFKKDDDSCKYCGGKGYHKMSCSSTKMTINVHSDLKDNDISDKIDDLLKKAESGVLKYQEYTEVLYKIIGNIMSIKDESKREELYDKIRKIKKLI